MRWRLWLALFGCCAPALAVTAWFGAPWWHYIRWLFLALLIVWVISAVMVVVCGDRMSRPSR